MDRDQFNDLMDKVRKTLGDENTAIISNELAEIKSIYPASLDEIDKLKEDVERLKKEKEDLVKVNGELLQKVGFKSEHEQESVAEEKAEDIELSVDDFIDEKGELKE